MRGTNMSVQNYSFVLLILNTHRCFDYHAEGFTITPPSRPPPKAFFPFGPCPTFGF